MGMLLVNEAQFVYKLDQSELQLDRSQLPNSKYLGLLRQEAAQPNIAKRPTKFKLATSLGSWEANKDKNPCKQMPLKSRTTQNMSVMPSQAESRPTMPHQQQPNQIEGVNRMGAEPQPHPRIPINNANVFIEVLQEQQMMEEIRQLKIDKTKEKRSQHNPEHTADKEETLVRGVPQNAEQRFIIMAEVAALLKQEKAKATKERFYAQRSPYPLRVLRKPYPEIYEPQAFVQYDGRKGSVVEHVSKFI